MLGLISPLLIPAGEGDRARVAYRLVAGLLSTDKSIKRDFLWREESPGAFTILSVREPEGCLPLFDIDVTFFEPRFGADERRSFRLRASPSVKRSEGPDKPTKRHDIIMDALRLFPHSERADRRPAVIQTKGYEWLARQGDLYGFALDDGHLQIQRYRQIAIPQSSEKMAELCTLDYEGSLYVRDPDLLLRAVTLGIGGGKAFGCGLMLLSS